MFCPPLCNLQGLLLFAFLLFPARAWGGAVLDCPEVLGALPPPEALAEFEATVLCDETLAILYNHDTKTPALVVERLTEDKTGGPAQRKDSRFKPDPRLSGKGQAGLSDYRRSGYDRGHMAPAADFKDDQAAMNRSFYLSNIAPQVGAGFNRGVWAALEGWVQDRANAGSVLFVFTGPVFYDFTPVIGDNRVVVPDAFFKLIFEPYSKETLAFLVPNAEHSTAHFMVFLIGPDVLEARVQIRFHLESGDTRGALNVEIKENRDRQQDRGQGEN